jgi:hypothetical protein
VGSDPLRICLRGLRPPTTSVLSTAGLWQWSILRRRGVVTRCWCDGGGGYPPSSGGGVYGGSTPSGDCPALCGGFRLGDLPSAIRWLATVCAGPGGGALDFFTARKGNVVLEYSWASACVCPPEGGPEVLVVHNGHCVA